MVSPVSGYLRFRRGNAKTPSKLAKALLTPTLREPCHLPAHALGVLGGVAAPGGGHDERARLERLLEAAAGEGEPPEARADALHALAWRRGLAGSRDAMLDLLRQAVETGGAADVAAAMRRGALGALLIEAGRREEGRAYLGQALAVFEQAEGAAPTEHALTLNALAGLARAGGGYADAALHLERAAALCERFPVAPTVALITRHNQASLALATAMRLPPVQVAPSEGMRGRSAASG